jgi:energy-coupling factor transporter ATP-binding protein EcfA2
LTVERNVLFGLEETRQCDAAHREYAYWLLQKVGLDQARDQYPRELSGGMQQRLSLARCLALEPDVLILDEPFSAVDQTTKADLLELVLELQSITRFTLLVILHDLKDAYSLADRVVVLAGRPARSVLDLELSGTDYITFQEKVLGAMNENRPTEPLTGSLLGLLACVRARENPSRQLLAKLSGRSSLLPVARRIKPPDVAYVLDLLRDRDPERLRLGILLSEAITANPDISKQLTTLWSRSLPTEARLALVRILTNTPGLLEPWIESEAVSFICEHWNDFKTHISRDLKGPRGQSLHYMSLNPETETGRLAALRLLAAASLSSETQDISRIIERLNGTGIPCLESLLSATGAQK